VLDVFEQLTGCNLIPKLRESIYVPVIMTYVDQFDEEIMIMKGQICEEFYPNVIIPMFMDLGAHVFKDMKLVVNTTIEQMQYVTLSSLIENFHKIFNISNTSFAEMVYNYLTDNTPF
jgi:hypothetical protein